MGMNEKRAIKNLELKQYDKGLSVWGEKKPVESFYAFVNKRYKHLHPKNLEDQFGKWDLTFDPLDDKAEVEQAFDDWKDWYASDARQLLSKWPEMKKLFEAVHDESKCILQITHSMLQDFKRCNPQHWEAEGFKISDNDAATLFEIEYESLYEDKLKQCLQSCFSTQGVHEVRVSTGHDARLIPAHD